MAKEISKNSQYVRFDWAIKRILRDTANKKVLEGLITVLVGKPVTIIEIIESGNNKIRKEDKSNCVDVKAKMEDGEIVIVEVQLSREVDFFQRILFGTATAINDQIGEGQDYEVIKKVYSINILYFDFGEGDDYAYHGYMDFHGITKPGTVLTFHTEKEKEYVQRNVKRLTPPEEVFPKVFLLLVNKFNEVAKTPIEEWMAYLKDGIIKPDTTTPGLQEAREKLDYMRMTREERRAYEDYMVSVHAARDVFETALADSRAEGRAQGLSEGRAQGLSEGRAEGRAEGAHSNAIDNACRMKEDNMPLELIVKYTGLSAEEIALL